MIASDASLSGANRKLWRWRLAAIGTGCVGAACVTGAAYTLHLPQVAMITLDFAVIFGAVLIAMYAETRFIIDDVARSDAELITRLKRRGMKFFILTMPIFLPLYIAGQILSHRILHLSNIETFLLSVMPAALIISAIRKIFPLSAGSRAETRRAVLLMTDRSRRVFVRTYAMFAVLSVVGIAILVPDLLRALHNLPIHPAVVQDSAFFPMVALLTFATPWPWRQEPDISDLQADETLSRYRLIAFRNGFVVAATGLVVVADLAPHLRLAVMLVPAFLNIAVGTAFATLAVLEYRAERNAEADTGDRDEAAAT